MAAVPPNADAANVANQQEDAHPDHSHPGGSIHAEDVETGSTHEGIEQDSNKFPHEPRTKEDDFKQQPQDGSKQDNSKKEDNDSNNSSKKDSDQPAGGYDATPIPQCPSGYTIKFTIHRANNLPMADIKSLSSDPYVVSQLYTDSPTRHKEDPPLRMRTFTVRKDVNPVWNVDWIVANVPASGFKLKCRIYDEDSADHDDRLGNAHIIVQSINDDWKGFREESFKIKKRMGSKRAYLVQAVATAVRERKHMDGQLLVSVENLGKTHSEHGARLYTVGPMWWTKHYSPLLGRIVGRKTPGKQDEATEDAEKAKAQKYNFQANQLQLHGPVPAELYHRFVEFRPFVKAMFTSSGIRGFFLQKALYHQHEQIYHFDRTTEFTYLGMKPSKQTTLKFLEACHFDEGGRIFTYIITLDSLFRFTETGKEFGIDMLSKHTMHSEVAIYIAFSGEFFIRRLRRKYEAPPEVGGHNETHPPNDVSGGPPKDEPPNDPGYYELVIDNDSGTYRPNAQLLPKLKEFLTFNLPGLKIVTLDCQKDAKIQQKLKDEQRQKKKEEGDAIVYRQASRGSSISSSDESDLEDMIARDRQESGFIDTVKRDVSHRGTLRKQKLKEIARGRQDAESRDGHVSTIDEGGEPHASGSKTDGVNGVEANADEHKANGKAEQPLLNGQDHTRGQDLRT